MYNYECFAIVDLLLTGKIIIENFWREFYNAKFLSCLLLLLGYSNYKIFRRIKIRIYKMPDFKSGTARSGIAGSTWVEYPHITQNNEYISFDATIFFYI